MAVYVYCPRKSEGAMELVTALGATRLRRFDGIDFWSKKSRFQLQTDDIVIAWGASIPELDGIRVLNALDQPINKIDEWFTLYKAKLPLFALSDNPNCPGKGYVPRVLNHQGGADLLKPPVRPDYWVYRYTFAKEYRIHSFSGRSIRAGIKVPRDGFVESTEADWKPGSGLVHPYVRSFDGGWRTKYDGFQSNSKLRKLAGQAVKALGLTFGAVDIGEELNGNLRVLEVNRAPGIEGGSIAAYTRAIQRWIKSEDGKEVEKPAIKPTPLEALAQLEDIPF